MKSTKFWANGPSLSPKGTSWKPGELRTYLPVLTLGVQPNTPAGGIVGKRTATDGTSGVSSVIRGPKTQKTTPV
jgi:hypothetical protein